MKLLVVKEAQQIAAGDEVITQMEWVTGAMPEPSRVRAAWGAPDGFVWLDTTHGNIRVGRLSLVCVLTKTDDA